MRKNTLLAALAASATLFAVPALANCGSFVQHSTISSCYYLKLPGENKPFVLQGKIPAQGSCPAKNASGNLEYRVTRATPSPLPGGWCAMAGWKDYDPVNKKTRNANQRAGL